MYFTTTCNSIRVATRHRAALAGTLLALAAAVPTHAQSTLNRRAEAIAITPAGPGAGHDVRAYLRVEAADLSTPTNVSTEVEVRLNGTTLHTATVDLTAGPGGGCADCEVGEVCICSGDPIVCDCSPWISGIGVGPVPLQPGDEIMVLLRPAPGAVPESDESDDILVRTFDGDPSFWNRALESVSLAPSSAGPGLYDVHASWGLAIGGLASVARLNTEIAVRVNGVEVASISGCDDIALPPSFACGAVCSGSCGTFTCFGPANLQCGDNPLYPGSCACMVTGLIGTIPGVPLQPEDEIMVLLRPVPGALPELPGFGEDEIPLCWGDIDASGSIGFGDLLALLAAWGPCAGCPEDLDGDGTVGFLDLLDLLSRWGPCPVIE